MKEFIVNNMEIIISFITMIITWIAGKIIKKHTNLSNKVIPMANIVIMLISVGIYYYATGSISAVIASGSPVATLIYDLLHTYKKDEYPIFEDAGEDEDEEN